MTGKFLNIGTLFCCSAFTSFAAVSGLMASHHRLTAIVTKWIASRGVNAENVAAYTSHMFHALTHLESTASADDFQGLVRECVTKGGLSELALNQLEELEWFDQVVECLDRIEERLEKILKTANPGLLTMQLGTPRKKQIPSNSRLNPL